jgi:hypothetical protein
MVMVSPSAMETTLPLRAWLNVGQASRQNMIKNRYRIMLLSVKEDRLIVKGRGKNRFFTYEPKKVVQGLHKPQETKYRGKKAPSQGMAKCLDCYIIIGAGTRNRTRDTRIFSQFKPISVKVSNSKSG